MTIYGACVKRSAQTGVNYSTPTAVVFDSEVFDSHALHDNSTDNTKLIIPAAFNTYYAILTASVSAANISTNNGLRIRILKNGAVFQSMAGLDTKTAGNGQATTSAWVSISTGPVVLATSDFFQVELTSEDTSIDVGAETCFSLYVLSDSNRSGRVLCKLNADATTQNYSTPAAIPFDGTDVFDTDSSHDPSSSNTKIIIPSALNGRYAVFTASVQAVLATTSVQAIAIRKGGSLTYDGFAGNSATASALGGTVWSTVVTHPIQVATGNEFEVLYHNTDTSITLSAANTAFSMRTVG